MHKERQPQIVYRILPLGLLVVCLGVYIALMVFEHLSKFARAELLYQGIGVALAQYAELNEGNYPTAPYGKFRFTAEELVATADGKLPPAFDPSKANTRHDEYNLSLSVRERLTQNGRYFIYLGSVVLEQDDVDSFLDSYRRLFTLEVPSKDRGTDRGTYVGPTLTGGYYQLSTTVAEDILGRSNPVDAAKLRARIPVVVEVPRRGIFGKGGMVLYLDNHVRYMCFPGEFPMTQGFFRSIDDAMALPTSAKRQMATGQSGRVGVEDE